MCLQKLKGEKAMKKIISVLLCFLLLMPALITANANEFPEKGGNDQRTHFVSDNTLSGNMIFKWKMEFGWSISQPVISGGFIYHLAALPYTKSTPIADFTPGTYLFKIPVSLNQDGAIIDENQLWIDWDAKGGKELKLGPYSQSRSHPTFITDNGTSTIYVGYGDPSNSQVAAIDPTSMTVLGSLSVGTSGAPNRLVSAPTYMGNDTIVFGDESSNVWGIKGLRQGNPSQVKQKLYSDSTAEITGSPTKVSSNEFIVGVNYRGQTRPAAIQKMSLDLQSMNLSPEWGGGVGTEDGVPTEPAYDSSTDKLYFTDKSGHIYIVTGSTGAEAEVTDFTGQIQLVNNSPAMGSSTVYFPIRRTSDNTGAIAAINKDGTTRFFMKDAAPIETDPLIITTANSTPYIFYGKTDGTLSALNSTGNKYSVTDFLRTTDNLTEISYADAPSLTGVFSSLIPPRFNNGTGDLKVTSNPSIPSNQWLQGGGVSTELTFGEDHFVFGANFDPQNDGDPSNDSGYLFSYFIPKVDNLAVEQTLGSPIVPGLPGQNVTYTVKVDNTGGNDVPATKLAWAYEDSSSISYVNVPAIPAGGTTSVQINTTYPSKSEQLEVFVNPNFDQPADEASWDDNFAAWNVPIVQPNLAVTNVAATSDSQSVTITADASSNGNTGQSYTTTVQYSADGNVLGTETVTINQGQTLNLAKTFTVSSAPSSVTVEINPGHDSPANESTWGDNKASATVKVTHAPNISINDKSLQLGFGDIPQPVDKYSYISVPIIVSNNSKADKTTQLTFTFAGIIREAYQTTECDTDSCWTVTKYRNRKATGTITSPVLTVPAFNNITWMIDSSQSITLNVENGDPATVGPMPALNVLGPVDQNGAYDNSQTYMPMISVMPNNPDQYASAVPVTEYLSTTAPAGNRIPVLTK